MSEMHQNWHHNQTIIPGTSQLIGLGRRTLISKDRWELWGCENRDFSSLVRLGKFRDDDDGSSRSTTITTTTTTGEQSKKSVTTNNNAKS